MAAGIYKEQIKFSVSGDFDRFCRFPFAMIAYIIQKKQSPAS